MDHPEITFGEDGPIVSIWVGTFGSQEAVDAYTAEQYDEDREGEPISPFAGDVGLKSYDHDFMEVHHEPGLSGWGVATFAQHSNGESFAKKAWAAARQQRIGEFDTVFMLYGYDHVRYPQATRHPRRVRFVGTFPYRMDQASGSS
jgi:hypothetical protein